MKILHIVWGMRTGGVETMLVNIINEQVKTENVSLFVVNDCVSEDLIDKINPHCRIRRLNRTPGQKNLFQIMKLNMWILAYRPNIIHVHSYQISKLILGSWNIVRTIHNTRNIPEEYPRMKALYAISASVAQYTERQGYQNVKIVPNGILGDAFRKKSHRACSERVMKIVQVSRLNTEQKGQHILIKALGILVNKYHVTQFTMHFIGVGESESQLKELVENEGLKSYIFFEGLKSQEYLHEHLCDYDLFIQPSMYEGFGLTVAEALAAKVPVLVSDIEGPMEIIEFGKAGMSFKAGDSVDLAGNLLHIFQCGYPQNLVENGFQRVMRMYDVHHTARTYIEEYKKVVEK